MARALLRTVPVRQPDRLALISGSITTSGIQAGSGTWTNHWDGGMRC